MGEEVVCMQPLKRNPSTLALEQQQQKELETWKVGEAGPAALS